MPLSSDIKFQKALALAAAASNPFEAAAAEFAARRLMTTYNIDPTDIPNVSLYSHTNFASNTLLKKLRDEWRQAHPVVTVQKVYTDLDGIESIPFSISGFSRHAHKKNKRRKERVILSDDDCEKIRLLFNEGLALKEVAEIMEYSSDTVNSARAYRIRKEIWRRDNAGKFYLANSVSNPCVTQPTGDSPR